jgi:hypothetical protein
MFPLSIGAYVRLGVSAIALLISAYLGYSFEHSRFVAFKASIVEETRKKEIEQQAKTDEIRKIKDAQIQSINNQLANALVQLRNRPSRSDTTSNGQATSASNGSQLFYEDSTFLAREAARADTIREALKACYAQYDEITK